eukprot:SAG31_NODE_197_length_20660_cov_8.861368_8_plen_88_part_00
MSVGCIDVVAGLGDVGAPRCAAGKAANVRDGGATRASPWALQNISKINAKRRRKHRRGIAHSMGLECVWKPPAHVCAQRQCVAHLCR